MQQHKNRFRTDFLQIGRGFLMGGADVVPGVSGGTVALILGIYQRLVRAISSVDMKLLAMIRQGDLAAAGRYVDLRFLVTLGCGILCGAIGLARVMRYLLNHHFGETWSIFFGLILASSILVARLVQPWRFVTVVAACVGAGFAFWLVGQMPQLAPSGYGYLWLCGVIGISAMILPGISGSFILVLMGKYADVIGAVSQLTDGTADPSTFLTLGVFATGCVVGLLAFSKVLRWLLAHYEPATLAVLCGFLVGSLRKIWPFKEDKTSEFLEVYGLPPERVAAIRANPELVAEHIKVTRRIYVNVWPEHFDAQVATYLALAVGAMVLVFVLHWLAFARRSSRAEPS
ncbi:MAG: DUF368 domain-containing protein [Planctomycetales bacterium]|nr:DUF368 domain-containing protein [Planctomycetales bacterium]NIM08183.1 DUF368 domain-containing protein [Planctomycetales bacterium]NIN07680.1 DUF368 domain-containing protein [Planctomycetales bacterium]NIN76797.1 DUF368 domain-containing protein [Planctomycetales bacterium]NIO34002.1 DUF368 domain-containing protein [Planctomycetales bacterium]